MLHMFTHVNRPSLPCLCSQTTEAYLQQRAAKYLEHADTSRTQRRWIVNADVRASYSTEFSDAFARESAAYQDLLDVAAWITQFSPSDPSLHEATCIFRGFLARLHAAEKETSTLISSGHCLSGNPAAKPPAENSAHQDISDLEMNDLLMHTLYD